MAVKASLELAIVGVKDLCVYQFHHLTIFVKFHKSGAAPLSTTPETIYTIGITVKKLGTVSNYYYSLRTCSTLGRHEKHYMNYLI